MALAPSIAARTTDRDIAENCKNPELRDYGDRITVTVDYGDSALIRARQRRARREGTKAFALPFHRSPELPPLCLRALLAAGKP